MESWKTLMMKNVWTTKYKMSDLQYEVITPRKFNHTFANIVVREPHDSQWETFLSVTKKMQCLKRQITKHLRKVLSTFHGKEKRQNGTHGTRHFRFGQWYVDIMAYWWDWRQFQLMKLQRSWQLWLTWRQIKKTIQQLQNEHKSLCRPTTVLYSRHRIFWNCRHGKRKGSDEQQYSTGMEMTIQKIRRT